MSLSGPLSSGLSLAMSQGVVPGGAVPPAPSPWILASGVWNDEGVWEDAAMWKDAP
jgi:hypothetical protein